MILNPILSYMFHDPNPLIEKSLNPDAGWVNKERFPAYEELLLIQAHIRTQFGCETVTNKFN